MYNNYERFTRFLSIATMATDSADRLKSLYNTQALLFAGLISESEAIEMIR